MDTLTIPTKRNAAEARLVMADTQKLLDEDARLGRKMDARASATTPPPSAADRYFSAIAAHLAEGKTTTEARRLVQTQQRGLVDAYTAEFTKAQQAKATAKTEAASLARRRRNHR